MIQQAVVVGDGPAGYLAALILCNAGANVTLLRGPSADNAHDRHVHILPQQFPDIASQIDRQFGRDLARRQVTVWTWHSWHDGPWKTSTAPHLSRLDVMQALTDRVQGLSGEHIGRQKNGVEIADPAGRSLGFDTETDRFHWDGQDYELCVDATGNSRATVPLLTQSGFDVTQTEIGGAERYISYQFDRPETLTPHQTWIFKSMTGDETAYLETQVDGMTLTCSGGLSFSAVSDPAAAHVHAAWSATPLSKVIQNGCSPKSRFSFVSPPVRHLQIAQQFAQQALPQNPAWIAFGDALMQVPAQSGFGLTSLLNQGKTLQTALNASQSPTDLRHALDRYASTAALHVAGSLTLTGAMSGVQQARTG